MSDKLATTEQSEMRTIDLIAQAVKDPNISVDKMRALFELDTDIKSRDAKTSFAIAMSKFQQLCPIISKADSANGKAYAKMDRIWSIIAPIMKDCGLSISWFSCILNDDNTKCTLDGALMHISGHSQDVHGEILIPEVIRGQNKAQVIGSAQTYAKRYATTGFLNIQTGLDDDGNCGSVDIITADQCAEIERKIKELCFQPARIEKLLHFGGAESGKVATIKTDRLFDIMAMLDNELREKEDLPL